MYQECRYQECIEYVEFFGFGRVKREVWLNDGSIRLITVPKFAMKKKRNTPTDSRIKMIYQDANNIFLMPVKTSFLKTLNVGFGKVTSRHSSLFDSVL